jgi:threonine aldolase
MFFTSDNWAGVSPVILKAIADAQDGFAPAYGTDPWTERATALMAETFGQKLAMAAVPTGTAANALALALGCGPDGTLVCHEEAHVVTVELDSRPVFSPGVEIVTLRGVGHKLDPAAVDAALAGVSRQDRPKLVSITNLTEAGCLYRPQEVRALANAAHRHGARLHVDGARFGNAVAASGGSAAELANGAGVDLLSFGATKNGALAAEAVVAFDPDLAAEMTRVRKSFGFTFSKGRFFGCQIAAYLENGHWLDLARHANAAGQRVAQGLTARGFRLAWQSDANEVMVVMPKAVVAALRAAGVRCHDWPLIANLPAGLDLSPEEGVVRFVGSFATPSAQVDTLFTTFDRLFATRAPAHAV